MRESLMTVLRSRTTMVSAVVFAGLLAGLLSILPADLVAPRPNDRHVTNIVTTLVERQHLSKHPLDDEISQRGLDNYLNTLDPMKVYFYLSDVAEFADYRNRLDDLLEEKDIQPAYAIFEKFMQRVDERVKLVDELLSSDFDFARDEDLVVDPDDRKYPEDERDAKELWRKRLKYDLLVLETDEITGDEAREKLRRRYHSFATRMHQTDADELLEMYLTAVTTAYDPHTTYMSPSSLENFRILMRLNLEGIGAALQSEDGYTKISKIIPGGAADKHGQLQTEDRIVSVGQGEDGEMQDVVNMKLGDVVKLIRGKAGTVVRLGVRSPGATETKIMNITRAKIELEDSAARSEVIEQGNNLDGSPRKIGVIDLPSFYMDMEAARTGQDNYKSTTRDVRRILGDFDSQGVDVVVLDLRRNGGGSLTEAINLTGLFVDTGVVVQVKDSRGEIQEYEDHDAGMAWKGPLIVLTSKFSASASEILAGAIQDYHRGLVIGDASTHGKGTVQSLMDLGHELFKIPNPPNLGALKITMQQFYRPNGDSTQKRGVLADIELPSISNHMDVSEADLDYAIEFDRIEAADYETYGMVDDKIVRALKSRSQARIAESEDFAKLLRNIERYKQQKARHKVSLNRGEFQQEREEMDADKEEEKQLEERAGVSGESDEVIKRDFYFNEILAIAADYARLLEHNHIAWLR